MKRCTVCFKEKSLDMFGKKKAAYDGLRPACKECEKIATDKYKRSKIGLVCKIYYDQVGNSKKRGYSTPEYTRQELINWALEQPIFLKLYDEWVESGYETDERPSCDRHSIGDLKYDYKPYNLSRLRICKFRDNRRKGDKDRMNGINNKLSVPVVKMDSSMNDLAEYYSVNEAARQNNKMPISITRYCQGKTKDSNGFLWRYA